VYRERDDFESELSDLRKRLVFFEAGHESASKERDDISIEVFRFTQPAFRKYFIENTKKIFYRKYLLL